MSYGIDGYVVRDQADLAQRECYASGRDQESEDPGGALTAAEYSIADAICRRYGRAQEGAEAAGRMPAIEYDADGFSVLLSRDSLSMSLPYWEGASGALAQCAKLAAEIEAALPIRFWDAQQGSWWATLAGAEAAHAHGRASLRRVVTARIQPAKRPWWRFW